MIEAGGKYLKGIIAIFSLSLIFANECEAIDSSELYELANSTRQSYDVAKDLYQKLRYIPELQSVSQELLNFMKVILMSYTIDGIKKEHALIANQHLTRVMLQPSCMNATEFAIVAPTAGAIFMDLC